MPWDTRAVTQRSLGWTPEGSAWMAVFGLVGERDRLLRMDLMKNTVLALCLILSACDSMGVHQVTPPQLAEEATALEVYESYRSYAADTDRRVLVHLGAPW
jgi:hypothetical protein